MGNINITMNAEKNGIEIRFDCRPNADVLAGLKGNGFRWSSRQKLWYAKQNDQTVGFAQGLSEGGVVFESTNNKATKNYSLFEMTRVEGIVNQYETGMRPKEIAAKVRQHIKPRFPMCRVSVTSDYNSVDVDIKSSPFEKGSNELEAIRDYITAYVKSFQRVNWEPYSDYYDSNFYFCRCDIAWDYQQTELTVSMANIIEAFKAESAAFEDAEELRRHREYEERQKQLRAEEEENKKLRRIAELQREQVENGVEIHDGKDCFITMLRNPKYSKLSSSAEYAEVMAEDEEPVCYRTCQVTRDVHMTAEQFAIFDSMLLSDWSFIAQTGGSETQDNRVNSMLDFQMMSKEERETVEWYSCGCVAIYCEGQLKYVVDAQGFGYCRYVYFPTEETKVSVDYKPVQVLSDEDAKRFKAEADNLVDISCDVIQENGLLKKWDGDNNEEYKQAMKSKVYTDNVAFNINVIRAIDSTYGNLKRVMYDLLGEINGIQEQFKRAKLSFGQRITIVKMGDFGGLYTQRAVFESVEYGKYAQYDNAVKLIIRPERKRNLYALWLYKDVMVYDGWLPDVPEAVMFDVVQQDNGVVTKKSKYLSCDRRYYDLAYEYYSGLGAVPLVNTDKPEKRKAV